MGWADSPPLSPDGGGILFTLLFIICIEILRRLSIDIHEEVYIKKCHNSLSGRDKKKYDNGCNRETEKQVA